LGTINTIHESLHAEHPSAGAQIMPVEAGFSHSLDPKRTSNLGRRGTAENGRGDDVAGSLVVVNASSVFDSN
jgi:hypothetical protein